MKYQNAHLSTLWEISRVFSDSSLILRELLVFYDLGNISPYRIQQISEPRNQLTFLFM